MKRIRQILTPIITVLMWVAVIGITTLSINLVFGKDDNVFVISAISTLLMTLTTVLWMPKGIELGENVTKVHNNTVIYQNRANYIVDNQMFKKADEFCAMKNAEFEKQLKTRRLAKFLIAYKDFETYEELYKKNLAVNCSEETRNEFADFKKGFSEKQNKVMEKLARKGVNFAHLTTDDLIKFHDTKGRLRPKNTENFIRVFRLAIKIVWGILLGLGTVGLIVTANEFGWQQALQLVMWSVSILSNIFTSIYTSYRSVTVNRNNYLIEKNDRCAEFFAYCNLKVTDIDSEVKDKLWKNIQENNLTHNE